MEISAEKTKLMTNDTSGINTEIKVNGQKLKTDTRGKKKTRQAEEEGRKQHQGMDRPGVRQVPEGSGEQGKIEEIGCEIICGAPTTVAVKG